MLTAVRLLLAALLSLAFMSTGRAQSFVDHTAASGVTMAFNNQFYLGRGVCFGDFDGDGDQDLIVPQGTNTTIAYYENLGNGSFIDRTAVAGLGACSTRPHACVAADVDNDGDLDLAMPGHWEPNRLYINDGNAVFSEQGAARGLAPIISSGFTASFGDYDRDGWVDLYIGNYDGPASGGSANQLFRNTGNGYFVDVTATAGAGDTGLCFTGIFHDYNDDGWPDIFVGNDKGWYPGQQPDTTYRNNGDGTFTDVGAAINTRFGIGAMGSDFTDAFNDGGWDIFVSNISTGHLFHVWNPTTGIYDELAAAHGVIAYIEGWATNFFDYDNDGWQDLYVVHNFSDNALFRNPGTAGGPWTDMGATLGCGAGGSIKHSSAIADIDNDGRVDIVCPRPHAPGLVFRNNVSAGNWIRFTLEGTVSNRSAIGAKVAVTVGGTTTKQALRTGHGYLSGHDMRLHFGAGTATAVDRVFIEWPSGQTQTLVGLATNTDHTIVEPSLALTGAPYPGSTVGLELRSPSEVGRGFSLAVSGGTGPLYLPDGRTIPADFDWLLTLTTTPGNGLLSPPGGTLDLTGLGTASLAIPAIPSLTGLTVHAAGVLQEPTVSLGIATIVGPTTITVQ